MKRNQKAINRMHGFLDIELIKNRIISGYLNIFYRACEPIFLRWARIVNSSNSEKDLVSIIIATYNRSNILVNRTLPSVLSQTHENIEVVVIGDHCIDDTPSQIKKINDRRLIFFDLPKRGEYPKKIEDRWFVQGSVPRNFGMKIAKGDWFVFISDDDFLYPNHVEVLLAAAKGSMAEFVSAAYKTVKDGQDILVFPAKNNHNSDLVSGGMQTWMYRSYLKCFKWNRHSWRKRYDRPVDYDLQQRLYRCGVRMRCIDNVVYYNPPVEGTTTTGYKAAMQADKL